MGCCCGSREAEDELSDYEESDDDQVDDDQVDDEQIDDEPQQTATVPIQLGDLNTIDSQKPIVYYVIIGRGPMAIVNHRTLLETKSGKKRLGTYDVLYVGFPNPWPKYIRHGLGQPSHLLSFPGITNQPSDNASEVDGGLDSQHFGSQFEKELATLQPAPTVTDAWVALIQWREPVNSTVHDGSIEEIKAAIKKEIGGKAVSKAITAIQTQPWPKQKPVPAYRLCLIGRNENAHGWIAKWVYAAAIDICTGPGRPKVDWDTEKHGETPSQILAARTPPWLSPEEWGQKAQWSDRGTMSGVDAIRDEVTWTEGNRICVTAGGGVGLNAAEKARNRKCRLDWFGRSGLKAIFQNPRNVTYLKNPDTDEPYESGELKVDQDTGEELLIASSKGHRMGVGAELSGAERSKSRVRVSLSKYAAFKGTAAIRDWWEEPSDLDEINKYWLVAETYGNEWKQKPSQEYDRLVIPNGQETNDLGQPKFFAKDLAFSVVEKAGRMVALATKDKLVRILGAACNDYPDVSQAKAGKSTNAAGRMWAYHKTLPVSAVPDGFIICGINTALANDYFDVTRPNMNVNTMTVDELHTVIRKTRTDPKGRTLAQLIVLKRRDNNGYKDEPDLRKACSGHPAYGPAEEDIARLRYTYTAWP